ncbi:hypothetical protein [Sphingosinicella sp. BN140058]|uniref:hypothetical protein n=1 Tax=Sphingosinicella sp. BN140058 TaxID=1892855 RepID=UPI0010119637|nr:hypothetical protein [Sphingosinicella sp. BN140058]QAY79289.1 hypothetical protein ETR14_24170 [Sphingosinicella sp. BN140058]
MERFLAIALLGLAISACGNAAPATAANGTCWLDAMSDAEKRALVLDYAEVQNSRGRAEADAWAQEQKTRYEERAAADGACAPAGQGQGAALSERTRAAGREDAADPEEPQILNDEGKPCKRIELENQNVPNVGGSMGWALIPVCKD